MVVSVLDADATPPLLASATLICAGPALTPQASISVMREEPASALVTLMRMRSVVVVVKLTVRLTRLLPLTLPSVTQEPPIQPWTAKAVTPHWLKVMVSVGSIGFGQL